MRNKIKQLLNKEEGFTLIELLGVIVILGLIVAIAIPSIGGIVKNSEEKTTAAQEELILDAARLYVLDKEDTAGSVTVENLEKGGYLEPLKVDSPYKKDSVTIKTNENGNTTYTIAGKETDE